MRRSNSKDIRILLGFLLLVSGGLSLFHGVSAGTQNDQKELWNQLLPLLMAGNVKGSATIIAQALPEQQKTVIQKIIKDKKIALSVADKIKMVFNVMLTLTDMQLKAEFLQLLIEEGLDKQVPLLYSAADGNYEKITPFLVSHFEKNSSKNNHEYQALNYAISQNNIAVAKKILPLVKLSPQDATKLLWEVINSKKDAAFIPELAKKGAQLNDVRAGKTMLIVAVENKLEDRVQALLQTKINVNFIANPAIGSALQMAIKKRYTAIELLLREHGARE